MKKTQEKHDMPDNLSKKILKTHAFFVPENLEKIIIKYKGDAALLVIDTQSKYCDPQLRRGNEETETVAERIQSIVPAFRKAGIPVYAVYFSDTGDKAAEKIDFYKFQPAPEDKLVSKRTNSAFMSGKLRDLLEEDQRKLLLVCGFNQAACVKETVLSARGYGYEVCLLDDLAGNDNGRGNKASRDKAKREMLEKGAIMTSSDEVLEYMHRNTAPKR